MKGEGEGSRMKGRREEEGKERGRGEGGRRRERKEEGGKEGGGGEGQRRKGVHGFRSDKNMIVAK